MQHTSLCTRAMAVKQPTQDQVISFFCLLIILLSAFQNKKCSDHDRLFYKRIISVFWNSAALNAIREILFLGLFLKSGSGREKQSRCKLLGTAMFSWLGTLLQGFRKLCLKIETKSLYWRQQGLCSLSWLFWAFADAAFTYLVQLGGLLRNHLSGEGSGWIAFTLLADLQLLLPQKLEKHRNFSCLLKPSGSTSAREAVTAASQAELFWSFT